MLIFNVWALLYLDPGLSPHNKKSVFLLIDEDTLPPCASMISLASCLDREGKVPVTTKILLVSVSEVCF